MSVPDWVPQNIAEIYKNQPSQEEKEVHRLTGLWVSRWQAKKVLPYLQS